MDKDADSLDVNKLIPGKPFEPPTAFRPPPIPSSEDAVRCDGSSACEAPLHLHGCFADEGNCDMPTEHSTDASRRPWEIATSPVRELLIALALVNSGPRLAAKLRERLGG